MAVVVLAAGCGPPATTARSDDDPALLHEVVSRQQRRVSEARENLTRLERELRMIEMRRHMLERDGRHDLAARVEMEEYSIRAQLAQAQRAAVDEEDALAAYTRHSARRTDGS